MHHTGRNRNRRRIAIATIADDDDWSSVSGPGTVTFANANVLSTTATFSAAGTYVLRLTASDSLLTSTDDVTSW